MPMSENYENASYTPQPITRSRKEIVADYEKIIREQTEEIKRARAALYKISSLLSDSGFIRDFDEEFVITNKTALQEALYIAEDCLKEGLNNGRC